CKLLAVGSSFFWHWEHPPMAVGTYTASGNSLLVVGMPCAFYSKQQAYDGGPQLLPWWCNSGDDGHGGGDGVVSMRLIACRWGKAGHNVDEFENVRVMLASLIANLKLDVNDNKMKHKKLKKANTSLSQDLEKSKQDLFYCISELEKYENFQTNHKDKQKAKVECEKAIGLLAETK
nr:hypothetical protein [Tanacetum cinerariifolium]